MNGEDFLSMLIQPMRDELVQAGFRELRTPEEVDASMGSAGGTTLLFVNSTCGCAGGVARPAAVQALQLSPARPDHLVTVFAGQDRDATARAREYLGGQPPSSPSVFLLRGGEVVFALPRGRIEGREPGEVAAELAQALAALAQ